MAVIPESYRRAHAEFYPEASKEACALRYEQTHRFYVEELVACLRGERSPGLSTHNLADLAKRYPEQEARRYAEKSWEEMWP